MGGEHLVFGGVKVEDDRDWYPWPPLEYLALVDVLEDIELGWRAAVWLSEPDALTEAMRIRALRRSPELTDPCPDCTAADLEAYGHKLRCPACGYLQPCCNP